MASIDTSLHPHPTGLAAQLAEVHSHPAISHPAVGDSQYLTLYGGWFCPFVQRVWIVLHELNIPHHYVEINPYKKEAHFLALNPRGLVPTLAISENEENHRGNSQSRKEKVLYESTVISNYLSSIYTRNPPHTQPDHDLYPSDPYNRARSHLMIDHISTKLIPSFYRFLQHTPSRDYTLTSARTEFLSRLSFFVSEMHDPGPYFWGEEISMVDISFIPWACRIFLLDHYKRPSDAEEEQWTSTIPDASEGKTWARFLTWFDAIKGRKSVRETLSEKERYIEVYWRYAEDKTQSEVGRTTRAWKKLDHDPF
jgi:glutathione S-transferase